MCWQPLRDRLEFLTAAWPEIFRPASVHSAEQTLLERRVAIYAMHKDIDELRIAALKELPNVVRQIARDVTQHQTVRIHSSQRHRVPIRRVAEVQHWIKRLVLLQRHHASFRRIRHITQTMQEELAQVAALFVRHWTRK
jgi:hypothetical protein